jgi:activating signal cointegrator complex subunit 3
MAEFAMFRIFIHYPEQKIIYIAPMKAIAKECLKDWTKRLNTLGKSVLELTGDYTPDLEALTTADVLITTPEKWDGISRSWANRSYVSNSGLLIFDEIHLLGQDRGPVLEVIVSKMNLIGSRTGKKARMVGLSTAMANGNDVGDWFGVKEYCFYNFKPAVRPVPVTIHFNGFPERAYCPRMATINKPAFQDIKRYSEGRPVIVFVSSRR